MDGELIGLIVMFVWLKGIGVILVVVQYVR